MSINFQIQPRNRMAAFYRKYRPQLIILVGFICLIWLLELLDWLVFSGSLDALGVKPRTLSGLKGILFMPFLHSGLGHLLANTLPFLVLGGLVMLGGLPTFLTVSGVAILVSGLGVWLLGGGNTVHLGASGLVFGFFGYLLTRAFFERSLKAVAVAVIVLVFYGGILWGLLPLWIGISWQGHLFGFLGGVLAAYLLNRQARRKATKRDPLEEIRIYD